MTTHPGKVCRNDHDVISNTASLNMKRGTEQRQGTGDTKKIKTEEGIRKPWEFGRFVQQSSKFIAIPSLPTFLSSSRRGGDNNIVQPGDILWESDAAADGRSSSSSSVFRLAPLDDVVMGGASKSTFDNATGKWRGAVTDANNGGFIGIRSTPADLRLNVESCRGIQFRLRYYDNDNNNNSIQKKRLKFGTRDTPDFNGIVWNRSADVVDVVNPTQWSSKMLAKNNPFKSMLSFAKNNEEENDEMSTSTSTTTTATIRIPFDEQIPTIFAKTIPDAPPFNKSTLSAIQMVYSKFEYDGDLNPYFAIGDVDLQLLDITAY